MNTFTETSRRSNDFHLEVVSYSALDRQLYVRWPVDGRYHQMGTVPSSLVDADEARGLAARMRTLGYEVTDHDSAALQDSLKEQTRRFARA